MRDWRENAVMRRLGRAIERLGGHEPLLLAALLLSAGALWGFAELADEVVEGETHATDVAILLALRNPADHGDPLGPGWLEEMMRDFTALGGVGVLTLLVLAGSGFLLLRRKRRTALLLLLTSAGGVALSLLLKQGFERPRPDLVPHGSIVYTASFPSGHSMLAALVYLTLGVMLARAQPHRRLKLYIMVLALATTLLVGVSRVYLGVHWPTDVLAGWMAGAAWAAATWYLAGLLQRRARIERAE